MTDYRDPLDERLSRDAAAADIVPSSGFAERVMTAVRASAEAPPPIPFPWLRVVPWAVVAAALVAVGAAQLATSPATAVDMGSPAAWLAQIQQIQSAAPDAGWTTIGVLISLVTLTFALGAGAWRRSGPPISSSRAR